MGLESEILGLYNGIMEKKDGNYLVVLMGFKWEVLGLYNNGIVEKKMETTV